MAAGSRNHIPPNFFSAPVSPYIVHELEKASHDSHQLPSNNFGNNPKTKGSLASQPAI
jgi:hypothetical protein